MPQSRFPALQTRLFDALEVPWADYSFPSGAEALRYYFQTRGDKVIVPMQRTFVWPPPKP